MTFERCLRTPLSRIALTAASLWMSGCEPAEVRPPGLDDPEPGEPSQPCDPSARITGLSVRLDGAVVYADGEPAPDVRVTLLDAQRPPGVALGQTTTTPQGAFTLDASDVTDWPGCWQIVLNYQLELRKDGVSTKIMVNREVFDAVRSEELEYAFRDPLPLPSTD